MYKYLFSCLTILLCIDGSSAQVITVSDEMNLKTEYVYDLLGKIDDNILVVRDGVNEFDIQAYDEDMSMTWLVEERLDNRKARIVDVIAHDKAFTVIYSVDSRDTIFIKSREYDGKVKMLSEDTLAMMKRGLIRPKFRYVKSEDLNIFLMTEIDNEKIVSAFAYNTGTQEVLWQGQFNFPNINFREDYRKTLLTNKGTMYLIFEKDNLRFRRDNHSLELFRYDEWRNDFARLSIPLPHFTTYDAHFVYDNVNQQVVIVGLYSDGNAGTTDGIYHISVDANDFGRYKLSSIDYDEDVIADFHGKYNPKKESLHNLQVQDIILRQDGGVLLLAEENKEYERLSYGARRDFYGSGRFSVDYYYEDLVLISIHPNGKSHWQKVLPKRQYSNDDQAAYSSYFLFKNPSFLRILYNDEIRNENTVSEYILNGAGDITRRSLMSTDNQRLKLQIKNALQIGSDELLVPSVRGKRLKLVKFAY